MSLSQFTQTATSDLLYTSQLDELHIAVACLTELLESAQFEEILDATTTPKRQLEGLEALINQIKYQPLHTALVQLLHDDPTQLSEKQLPPLVAELRKYAESMQIIRMIVAVTFESADLAEMATLASEGIGKPVIFDLRVDSSIIGGAIVEYGSSSSDYSLRTRLTQFREHWHQASFSTDHA